MPKKKKTTQPKPPQMYIVDIWDRVYRNRTTISKDIDTFRGQLAYSESRDKIINLSPTDAACENVIQHGYLIENVIYSPTETPKDWIMNMHKAFLNPKYIASEAVPYYESEIVLTDEALVALGESPVVQTFYPDSV